MQMKTNLLAIRRLLITMSHSGIILTSLAVAFWIRFEFSVRVLESPILLTSLIIVVPIKMATFVMAGLPDLLRIYLVNIAASAICTIALLMWFGQEFPRSVYVIDFLVCFLLTAGARFCVRLYNETLRLDLAAMKKGILIYGAGAAGRRCSGKS